MNPINFFKKKFALIPIVFFSMGVAAGDSMNNGDGLAEQNFLFVYTQLSAVYEACIQSEECPLIAAEKKLIQQVQTSFLEEQKTSEQIRFLENQSDTFFLSDGQILVAKTEPQVGAFIWVNRDLIYKKTNSNESIAFTEAEAVGTLTEQLLVHQQVSSYKRRLYISLILKDYYQKHFLHSKIEANIL